MGSEVVVIIIFDTLEIVTYPVGWYEKLTKAIHVEIARFKRPCRILRVDYQKTGLDK
jgi:hypothetical protein